MKGEKTMKDLEKREMNTTISNILETVGELQVIEKEDHQFLVENKEHFAKVFEKTYIWRTDIQKKSIINDIQFPTVHSKFHQSILEQKVQFDQAMYLGKDFEMKKMEIEILECDLEELESNSFLCKRSKIDKKKIELEIKFKTYELKNMKIAMQYRLKEIKGWKEIQNNLLASMKAGGLDETTIWDREKGEATSMFFSTLNNLQGLKQSVDAGEQNNLISLAVFSVTTVKEMGIFEELKKKCNDIQLDSLKFVENVLKNRRTRKWD